MDRRSSNRYDLVARVFVYSVGGILFFTAIAKFISAFGKEPVLRSFEPVSHLTFRTVFLIFGLVELMAAWYCISSPSKSRRLWLIGNFGTFFLVYRLGLKWMDYHMPCRCIGSLTDMLNISPNTADSVMKLIAAYMVIGGYGILLWSKVQRNESTLEKTRVLAG